MYLFTLKQTAVGQYTIYSESGVEMHVIYGSSKEDAMFRAQAYISSWRASQIRWTDEQG